MPLETCTHVYPEAWRGRCGRYPVVGKTRCPSHDPEEQARLAGVRAARKAEWLARGKPLPAIAYRDQLIRELAELPVWWDGPGSEGRCV